MGHEAPALLRGLHIFLWNSIPGGRRLEDAGRDIAAMVSGDRGMTAQTHGRVLLVDDEALIRMGMRTILHSLGYEVVGEASNGQDALDKVAALRPDVVIMDIKMPVMDGLEATRRLMATHPVPVIVLTAYTQPTLVGQAAGAGVLGDLGKPVREGDIKPGIEAARGGFADLQGVGRTSAGGGALAETQSSRIAGATRILQPQHRLSEAEASARLRRLAKN